MDNNSEMLFLVFLEHFKIIPELAHKISGKLSGARLPSVAFAAEGPYSGNDLKQSHKISLENQFIPNRLLLNRGIKYNTLAEKAFENLRSSSINKKINLMEK